MQIADHELTSAVAEELDWDPKIDSNAVTVSADAGVVSVRGTVGSYTEKCEVKWDVLRVRGVVRVEDQLSG
jgi:osmotically-inducible protein OsmY